MSVTVRQVAYHQAAWDARGGRWVLDCDACGSYGQEFAKGYHDEQAAIDAGLRHRCDPQAVAQVEGGQS